MRGNEVFVRVCLAGKALVEVSETDAGDNYDGEAGGEGEDDEGLCLELHAEWPDELDGNEEDGDFSDDVEGANGLPLGPLVQVSNSGG